MSISIYTFAKDAIRLDFHLESMLNHHLPFADEIVIIECYSRDNTFNVINNINSRKIKVDRVEWDPTSSHLQILDNARARCTSEWCIKLDIDEFIPEWEWDRLRNFLRTANEVIVPIQLVNFYGNYRVFHSDPEKSYWPYLKWPIHRNSDKYELWGDSSNIKMKGKEIKIGRIDSAFEVHHFGAVRKASRLREKWRTQAIRNQKNTGMYKERGRIIRVPPFIYNFFCHEWLDQSFLKYLQVYDGPLMNIVKNNPGEFVRDRMKTYDYLKKLT